MKIHMTLLLLMVALLLSCTTPQINETPKSTAPTTTASGQKLYQEAQTYFDHGQDDAAAAKIQQLLKKEPNTDFTDDGLLLLGRVYFRKKQYSQAFSSFEQIYTSQFKSPRENEARILGVQSLLAMDKQDAAEKLIKSSLAQTNLSAKEKAYLLEAQLPLLMKREAQLETFEALAFLAQNHPNSNSREKYRELAKNFIDSKLSSNELKEVSEDAEVGDLRAEAMFQYALKQIEANNLDSAKYYFSRIISIAPNTFLAQQSEGMAKQLDARSLVEPRSIGAVLPMSGPYAQIGEQTLRGLQMALGISGSNSKYNLRLVVQDSLSTPEDAAKAVEKLIYSDHVIAIVGGLSAKTVVAEATRAQELGVPFLALSQKADLTKIGPFIYAAAITPKMQTEALVSYAMSKLKYKNFAVIYPNDRYGVEFANIFWDTVVTKGGKVTTAQTYTPGETDFKPHVRKMVGTYYLEDRYQEYQQLLRDWKKKNTNKRKQPPETLLPPIIQFEALFIPDDPKTLGQIAPMLAFNDVNDIYLLGTNLWNSPELLQRAQGFLERSIFVDTHLNDSPEFTGSPFYKEFRQTFKDRPGSFALLGYDSGKLALHAIQGSARNRIDFMRLLSSAQNINGAISPLTISPDRELIRSLVPLTVKKNQFLLAE